MKKLLILLIGIGIWGCQADKEKQVTNPEDYNVFLNDTLRQSYKDAASKKEFWSQRLKADTSGIGDIAPLAAAYSNLFETTGEVDNLKKAEVLYRKAVSISANNKDGYTRSLAHNLISQHRFKEAKELLEESHAGPSHKHETELMLFDVYMELGEYERANQVLEKVKSNTDYNYLIRLSKWNDHIGNLDEAIKYMVQAKRIAESRDSKALKIWTYSNLGDYYGHAGRIEDSYQHYLKTLQLQPDNAYAKKGIAWIIYSYEGNTNEANRILDAVMKNHAVPDYYLLKAEMAEFEKDSNKATANEEQFIKAVETSDYGAMYNAYLIEYYADKNPDWSLEIAQKELQNRATPETYHLLALAQLKNGAKEQALETIEKHVEGKTFEPMAQYHSALVYKANGLENKVKPLKSELLEASFELGPVLTEKIESL